MAKSSSSSDSDSSDSSSEESEDKKKKKKAKKDKKKASKGKSSKKKKDKKAKKKKKKDKKKEKKDKDPYSRNAIEKARLEAQQRLMGLNAEKSKKKKKKGKSSSSSSSSEEQVERLRDFVEGTTAIREQLFKDKEKEKAAAPEPEKPASEMTWPERAAAAACKAENEAIWRGASQEEAREAAEEAGEAVMRRAVQFGYVEPTKRARFDAAKGGAQKPKLSPVEQARSAGLHPVAFAGGGGPTFRGGGNFGVTAPKMTGGLEGGYMG